MIGKRQLRSAQVASRLMGLFFPLGVSKWNDSLSEWLIGWWVGRLVILDSPDPRK